MADEEELDALFGSDDDDQPGFREDDAGLTSPQAGGEDSPGVVPRYKSRFCCGSSQTPHVQHWFTSCS